MPDDLTAALLRLDAALYDEVKQAASRAGVSVNRWLVEAVADRVRLDDPAAAAVHALEQAGYQQLAAGEHVPAINRWPQATQAAGRRFLRARGATPAKALAGPAPVWVVADASALLAASRPDEPGHELWRAAVFGSGLPVIVAADALSELIGLFMALDRNVGRRYGKWLWSQSEVGGSLWPTSANPQTVKALAAAEKFEKPWSASTATLAAAIETATRLAGPVGLMTRDATQASRAQAAGLSVVCDADPLFRATL